jgi:hypothetical protein
MARREPVRDNRSPDSGAAGELASLAARAGRESARDSGPARRLVELDVVSHGSSDDIRFRRVGPVSFKGVSRDVVIYEAERA